MAYCRSGPDSDVYMYKDISTRWFYIYVGKDRHEMKQTPVGALIALQELEREGFKVPQHTYDRLRAEIGGWDKYSNGKMH